MTQSCLKGDSTMMKGKLNETRVPSASFTLSQGIEEELLLKLYDNFHKIETEIVSSKTGDVVLYDQEKQSIDDESDDSSSHKPTLLGNYSSMAKKLIRDTRYEQSHSISNKSTNKSFIKKYYSYHNCESQSSQESINRNISLNLYCEKKPGVKIISIDRNTSIESLKDVIAKKFRVPKVYDTLVVGKPHDFKNAMVFLTFDLLQGLKDSSSIILIQSNEHNIISLPKNDSKVEIVVKQSDIQAVMLSNDHNSTFSSLSSGFSILQINISESERLLREYENILQLSIGTQLYTQRLSLPIQSMKQQIVTTINTSQVLLVHGETGSGKTTQLPIFILEDRIKNMLGSETMIICTQPRRLAAITIAERISNELGVPIGTLVGYQVRLQSKFSTSTRLLFCTTGVLLSYLRNESFFDKVSHIILDEVHERQVENDFLMAIFKSRLSQTNLKLILTSATMQIDNFAAYFNCPVISISGRTFPVKSFYLENILQSIHVSIEGKRYKYLSDLETIPPNGIQNYSQFYDIIADLICSIMKTFSIKQNSPGETILVIVSGFDAIRKIQSCLASRNIGNRNSHSKVKILTLHGSMSYEQQKEVFFPANEGHWKVILATNIVETSITIDDVTHVIDSGLVNEIRFDSESNLSTLKECLISRASAKQREGRAGRVREGFCWKLYTEDFYLSKAFQDFTDPEIQRISLEEVILRLLAMNIGTPDNFLATCLNPPSSNQIRNSVYKLLQIKAILPLQDLPLTPLGRHLSKIPLDVRLGKMLVLGVLLKCEDISLTIAAALSGKSIFLTPRDKLQLASEIHSSFLYVPSNTNSKRLVSMLSDHIAVVNAYNQWIHLYQNSSRDAAFAFCKEKFLSYSRLDDIRRLRDLFRGYLEECGLLSRECQLPPTTVEIENIDFSYKLALCALSAGLYPQMCCAAKFTSVKVTGNRKKSIVQHKIVDQDGSELHLHPSSIVYRKLADIFNKDSCNYLVYNKKVAMDNKVTLFDISLVPINCILLFGGDISIERRKSKAIVDGWARFNILELHASIFIKLQCELDELLQDLLSTEAVNDLWEQRRKNYMEYLKLLLN